MGALLVELMIVGQLSVVHVVVAVAPGLSAQQAVGQGSAVRLVGAIFIGGEIVVQAVALHGHARERQVVVGGEMEGQSGPGEESAAVVVVLAFGELVGGESRTFLRPVGCKRPWVERTHSIALVAHVAAGAATLAIAQVGIGIDPFRRIVDVAAHVPALVVVGSGL